MRPKGQEEGVYQREEGRERSDVVVLCERTDEPVHSIVAREGERCDSYDLARSDVEQEVP